MMGPEHRSRGGSGNDDYVPMEKRVVKKAAKGCLYLFAIPAAVTIIVLIDSLLSKIGHFSPTGPVVFIMAGIWVLFGLFTLLYLAPRKIIPEARKTGSMDRGVFSLLIVFIIAACWIAIITQPNPSGLKTGITAVHLIQWGVILIISHFLARGLWSLFRPKHQEKPTATRIQKRKPAPVAVKGAPVTSGSATRKGGGQQSKPIKRTAPAANKTQEAGNWEYCENCGKKGARLFAIFSNQYTFCNETCKEEFGNKLYRGGAFIFCPYCGTPQRITDADPRICRRCSANMDDLKAKGNGADPEMG